MPAFLNHYVQYPPETWTGAGVVVLERLLSVMDANPFRPFQEMDFNDRAEWLPYDKERALAYLKRGSRTVVHFRTQHPFYMQGALAQLAGQNSATLRLSEHFLDDAGVHAAGSFLVQLALPLAQPRFGWCEVDSYATRIVDFYDDHNLRALPWCFGTYLGWRHILSPAAYTPYIERQTLLRAPAWQVHEDEQGLIELVIYDDPLSYDTAQSQQRIVDVTTFLHTHRKRES